MWGEVLTHPRHEVAQKLLPELIMQLRQCRNVDDGYELQKALFDLVYEVDTARNGFRQAARRMQVGKPPQPGAPEPQSGLDTALLETWQFDLTWLI